MSAKIMQEVENRIVGVSELRVEADGKVRKIVGYAAKFGVRSSVIAGMFRETIQVGAFATHLPGADVPFLVNHDAGRMLARTKSGTLRVSEDAVGLRFDATLPDTTLASDVVEQIQRGDLDSMSFAFNTVTDSWGEDEQGFALRTLMQVRLHDVSLATFPAYDLTEVALRELQVFRKQQGRTKALRARLRLISLES